ncbi:copper resistance CopC family protein [Corynebacterium anserum]|uniref:Copper resistance protein CopC n=1 Tax=Corynebacterium anserum TaxID=2684406 RepID=A0A7G7YNL5_9CORY|nr:copper resistance protein CopC [Corynebacterium anserum]MBC2681665.1 copper resistance protein CopC [Corynebacterium anserum]QNH96085.1 copper resistance protein CopC [Corynebacterium anserum]
MATVAVACTSGLLGSVLLASPALAHDSVVSSNPQNGAHIGSLPHELTLEFSGEPRQGYNTVALSRDGDVLFSGKPNVNGRVLTIDVPDNVESNPGNYLIGFQITSSDGHATRGSLDFTVDGDGSASNKDGNASENVGNSSASPGQQRDAHNGVPGWLLPLGGIFVVAGALVIAIARFGNLKK